MRCFFMKSPMAFNFFLNVFCQGNVQTGCEAKGMRSDVIRKKSSPYSRLNSRIFWRQLKFSSIVVFILSSEYDASRNVLELLQERDRLMQGYPIFMIDFLFHFAKSEIMILISCQIRKICGEVTREVHFLL